MSDRITLNVLSVLLNETFPLFLFDADKPINWREVYRIGVQYRRLVDPDQPLFWVDSLPDHLLPDGFRSDITFVRSVALFPYRRNFILNL